MINKFYKKIILLLLFLFPFSSGAAMLSDSYVIYENIHHKFDGPVISSISSSVTGVEATVTWTTNVLSDSFVVYSTDASVPLATSMEQGSSQKTNTSHTVVISGLEANTTYYFRVKSTRVNGGTSIDSSINSFTTGDDPDVAELEEAVAASSGGGMIIIDKTDKIAPVITNVVATATNTDSVIVTWTTDEYATSFVEYGKTDIFGSVYGEWASTTEHRVVLEKLELETNYSYRVLSSDSWGNLAKSDTYQIALVPGEDGEEPTVIEDPEEIEELPEEPEEVEDPGVLREGINDFLRRIFPEIALNEITDEQLNSVGSFDDLSNFLSAPILTGEPDINISADEATISWFTDIDSSSQIAFAPEDRYDPLRDEPYYLIVGNTDELTTDHEVTLFGLEPDTTYHFQIRSKPRIGPTAISRDYSFATDIESLQIESFFSQVVNDEEAVFKWVTNKEADSVLKFSPYQGNIVALDQQKIIANNEQTVIHELTVSEFQAGVYYDVIIESSDSEGNVANETMVRFSTSEEDLPPVVSHVKADSTVFLDRSNKTQTIISWVTNEPSTSKIHYQEGVHNNQVELSEGTDLNNNYTKEHVMVITKFKPGVVYSFRVESIDSGGNTTLSKVHTFMTAKQKDSIIQIIIRIFEDTFGWVKKLK